MAITVSKYQKKVNYEAGNVSGCLSHKVKTQKVCRRYSIFLLFFRWEHSNEVQTGELFTKIYKKSFLVSLSPLDTFPKSHTPPPSRFSPSVSHSSPSVSPRFLRPLQVPPGALKVHKCPPPMQIPQVQESIHAGPSRSDPPCNSPPLPNPPLSPLWFRLGPPMQIPTEPFNSPP